MAPDDELVRQAQDGDLNALGTLLRRYETQLHAFLTRLLADPMTAEDATQDVFITVMKKLSGYHEQGAFKAWLFTLAHRQGLKVIRGRQRGLNRWMRPTESFTPEAAAPERGQPDLRLLASEDQEVLEAALIQLPPAEREVIHLHVVEGLTFKEIAAITGCPINTALGRMRNARRRLKETLKQREKS